MLRSPAQPSIVALISGHTAFWVSNVTRKSVLLGMLQRMSGALGRIRTPDPLIRSQILYPTELPARGAVAYRPVKRSARGQQQVFSKTGAHDIRRGRQSRGFEDERIVSRRLVGMQAEPFEMEVMLSALDHL